MTTEPFTELIPGLPEEIALECLTRLHYSTHRVSTLACRRWRDLLLSREFYYHRKRAGQTRSLACLVQSVAQPGAKPAGPVQYGITVFDPESGSWERLEAVPGHAEGLPLFCQVASAEGKLVVMGGWDPQSYRPVRDVFVYEFTTRRWTRGAHMPEERSFFACGEAEGRVVVAGGHDGEKNASDRAWVYDVAADDWAELGRMSQERDECQAVAVGSEFWIVSGYKTENQGRFEASAEALDLGTGLWRRVEGAWREGECPRSCVGVGRDGRLASWAEEAQVGTCAVGLGGERTLVAGSSYEGGPLGFVIMEGKQGQKRKLNVEEEFSGFIQSGCCVEI